MSTRRVPVNAAWLFIGRTFAAAITVVIISLSTHRLTFDEFGLVASTMAAGFLANTLVTFGTDTVVTRAVAAQRRDAAALSFDAVKLQLVVAAVLSGAAGVAVSLGAPALVLVQALALLPMAIVTVASAVLRGRERMDQLLVATVLGGVAALVCVLRFFAVRTAAWIPVASLGIGSAVTAVITGWFATDRLRWFRDYSAPEPHEGRLSLLLRETAPFAVMVLLAAIGAQAGLLLVEFIADEPTGGYGVAVRLSEAARLIPAAAMGAFFPAMLSGLHSTQRYRRWLRWLIGYAVIATAALMIFADPINRIVFDDQPTGTPLIRILAIGLIFTVVRLAVSFELIADGRERIVLVSAILGAAIAVIAGLLTASPFGPLGVAWSQIAGVIGATVVLVSQRPSAAEASPAIGMRKGLLGDRTAE